MSRVYVLEYKIHVNLYSLSEPNLETRTSYYSRDERDDFIQEYLRIKDKYYIQDVKSYFAELKEVNMDDIINVI